VLKETTATIGGIAINLGLLESANWSLSKQAPWVCISRHFETPCNCFRRVCLVSMGP